MGDESGCAPAAHHSLVSLLERAQPLTSNLFCCWEHHQVGMSMWGSVAFHALVLLMFATGGHAEAPSQVPYATKLLPYAGQGCSNSRFIAAVRRQQLWGHFCKTAPCSGQRWWEAGTPSATSAASLQPAPALPNTPSSSQTAPRNTAFPWNVFV